MSEKKLTIKYPLPLLTEPLLRWFRRRARDLPWRHTRDPYRIWVSEIMLQQTRVAAVLGYYDRFLTAFPSVEALAKATEDRLLKAWEGLGYYSRARNLQRAAMMVAASGRFPASRQELMDLPGIGEYTAGAIASAAFGQREAAVDGNVLRAVARLTDCHADILNAAVRREVQQAVQTIMPEKEEDIRIFNQAMMELGATVCVPKGPPRCGECPCRDFCLGHSRGTAEKLPVRSPRRQRRVEEKTVFVLLRQGKAALHRRPAVGLLALLWEFPNMPGVLNEEETARQLADWGLTLKNWVSRLTARHIFTHVEWRMTGYVLEVSGRGLSDWVWMDRSALAEHAVPSAFSRFFREAEKQMKNGPAE